MKSLLLLFFLCSLGLAEEKAENTRAEESAPIEAIANLTDPKKLATLKGERASNPRFQKCLYWIESYEKSKAGERVDYSSISHKVGVIKLIQRSVELNGLNIDSGYCRRLATSLLLSFTMANDYGLFTTEGMNELRQGKAATITKGEYAGQEATADHIIPLSVCPELQNQIFNLQFLPASLNSSKGNKVKKEQVQFAKWLNEDGLLSDKGLEAVMKAYEKESK